MGISSVPVGWEDDQDEPGCAYLLDEWDGRRVCGAPRKAVAPSRKAASPIARSIMRSAMPLMAARPRLTVCAR